MPPVLRHFYARQSLQDSEISATGRRCSCMARLALPADVAAESCECCLAMLPQKIPANLSGSETLNGTPYLCNCYPASAGQRVKPISRSENLPIDQPAIA
jgi:hypothetical protein